MCANIFFRAKTRFHLPQKRAIFVGFFIEFSAPHRCLMSSLAPLESSFYTLSNGTKLDISSARGAIVQPFFFLENHEKSRKLRVFHRSSAQSAKNKTSRFQHRNASAHSAKNKTSRFQHTGAQFENPLCHDPLLCMVRLEERLYYMFFENHSIKRRLNISNPLKITALQRGDPDVVDFRIKRPYVDFLCSKLNL